MELYVVRHGETVGNAGKIIQGNVGGELSERGITESIAACGELPSAVVHVYASDLNRARQTGEIVAKKLDRPLTITFALREGNLGHLEGKPWSEYISYDWNHPGLDMESIDYVVARLNVFLSHLYAVHTNDKIVLVTHTGVIKALVSISRGVTTYPSDVKTANGSVSVFTYDGSLKLVSLNNRSHLPADVGQL